MSHNKEREEKNCLNCNAVVYGRYCHVCGQENIEPRESFWHLVTHFTYDITHFDGKFFSTLKYLLFNPGFLSKEYLRGRRASYLHPIRMYVFASAVFFFIYFAINKNDKNTKNIEGYTTVTDTLRNKGNETYSGKDSVTNRLKDTAAYKYQPQVKTNDGAKFQVDKARSNGLAAIDPKDDDVIAIDKKISNSFIGRAINNYREHREEIDHLVPKVMFRTLPLVALSLMLLYRRRKDLFYVDHLILVIHLFTAIYILYLVEYFFNFLGQHFWEHVFSFLSALMGWIVFFYVYKTLRNFYEQKRFKTFIKCCALFSFFWLIFLVVYSIFISPLFLL